MAKKGMDDEALTIQRCARLIEDLEDEAGQARVALYLYLRYTAAGERIAPGHADAQPSRWRPAFAGPAEPIAGHPTAEPPVSGPEPIPDAPTPPDDSGAADAPAGAADDDEQEEESDDEQPTGWDIGGQGSDQDDDASDLAADEDSEEVEI